jgi:hypothetical protein
VSFANTGNKTLGLTRSDVEISRDVVLPEDKIVRRNRLYEILSVGAIVYPKADEPQESIVGWSDDNFAVVLNTNALPRAYLVSSYEVLTDSAVQLRKLFDPAFDPNTSVILEESPGFAPVKKYAISSPSHVEITKYRANRVEIVVETSYDGLLVLTDTYESGWQATVDGKEAKIYRANYTFRAVYVPKGNHHVIFTYQPTSLILGLRVTYIAIALWFLSIGIVIWKRNS